VKISNVTGAVLLAATALLMTLPSARADALADVQQAKKIRVGIDLGLPPFGMTDEKLQPTGSDVETARLLAADLRVELELVSTTSAARVPSLQSGKADLVISSLAITPEREKVIDFSQVYAVLRVVVAAPKDIVIKDFADLDGKTVGLARGTTQDLFFSQKVKNARVVRYEDEATTAQAYVTGQIDIFSTAELVLRTIAEKNPSRKPEVKLVVRTSMLAVGVRKGEAGLLARVNEFVKNNLKNGKLNAIYKKYHGTDLPDEVVRGGA